MKKTGIVLLAAGNASRMGKPKQLLPFGQQSMLEHSLLQAQQAVGERLLLVLGAYQAEIRAKISEDWPFVVNTAWQTGMAGSIRIGMEALLTRFPDTEQLILAVADQPYVSAGLFEELRMQQQTSGKGIVACSYADTQGVPVLFDQAYFAELQNLEGQEGAKKLLKSYTTDVETVPFPKGAIDMDTVQDYERFCEEQEGKRING